MDDISTLSVPQLGEYCQQQTHRYWHEKWCDERFCSELFRRFCQGNRDAFERLYTVYSPQIRAFCCRALETHAGMLDANDADDVCQEGFIRFFRAFYGNHDAFQSIGKAISFIQVAISRYIIDKKRKIKHHQFLSIDRDQAGANPSRSIQHDDWNAENHRTVLVVALKARISALVPDDKDQEILMLHLMYGLRPREIVPMIGISAEEVGNLRARISRLLIKIRSDLEVQKILGFTSDDDHPLENV